ncbi:MAG: adenylate/guanylate cyclase domain-containing protein [Pseudomonadota bacterium]
MSAEAGQQLLRKWRVMAEGPGGRTREFILSRPSLVGRDPTCDICLEGRKISRRHFSIAAEGEEQLKISDLQSHNGTHFDGKRISEIVLNGGEKVQAGEWTLSFLPDRRKAEPVDASLPVITDDFAEDDLTLDFTDPLRARAPVVPAQISKDLAWSWEPDPKVDAERLRLTPIASNPLVQHLRSRSSGKVDISEVGDFKSVAMTLDRQPTAESIETLALSLLYRVMAESHLALTLDDFLGKIADALLNATQSQGVAVLLPEGSFGEMKPRVVRLAKRIRSLHLSQTVVERAVRDRSAVVAANAASDMRFASGESVMRLDLKAVLCVPLLRDEAAEGAIYLTRERPFLPPENDLVGALGHLVGLGIEQSRLREQVQAEASLRSALERFHTPEVVEKIMLNRGSDSSGGLEPFLEPLEATVLFCDLSSFTAFAERHPPSRVADLLNAYLARMTEVVFQHRGTVDKYIGDAVMALFGAPFPGDNDAERAVACALAMRSAFNAVIAERPPAERLRLRIGLNTGPVVAGLIGSRMRLEYTALGDAVNVAARLEEAAEPGQILIGPRTMELVQGQFLIQPRGAIPLKGKAEPVEAFEVVSAGPISTR